MDQSITIRIGQREYPLKASSPEMEQLMRIASETINQKLAAYDAKFPDKELVDKFAFLTLNETITRLSCQKKANDLASQLKSLTEETEDYLTNAEK